MMLPSVILLLVWMVVPLAMTLWYSFQNYNLLTPQNVSFAGFFNYIYFYTDPAFFQSIWNTLVLVLGVLLITVVGGIAIISFVLGLTQSQWLYCEDFAISGNSEPAGCTPEPPDLYE